MSDSWPLRYPQYLPYPQPIRRGWRPVPNAASINWPQAQFAPQYLPAGMPSVSPYVYPDKVTQPDLYVVENSALNMGGISALANTAVSALGGVAALANTSVSALGDLAGLGCTGYGCAGYGEGMEWEVAGVTITPKCIIIPTLSLAAGWFAHKWYTGR